MAPVCSQEEHAVSDGAAGAELKLEQAIKALGKGRRCWAIPDAVAGAQLQPLEAPAVLPQPPETAVAGADATER